MKIEIDYKIGQPIFLRSDEEQAEYRLNRIIIEQKQLISLELFDAVSCTFFEVPEIHCTKEKDILKAMGSTKREETED